MKAILILLSILLASAGVSQPVPPSVRPALVTTPAVAAPALGSSARRLTVTWADIHGFIVANAASYTAATESRLQTESLAGVKTWEIAAARVGRRDGGGLGWPTQNDQILFGRFADAVTCGAMIDEYRNAVNP